MGMREVGDLLARDQRDKDLIKTQFDPADVSAYFSYFTDKINITDRGLRVTQLAIDTSSSFILGHAQAGVLGTSPLGRTVDSTTVIRVVHPNRKYIDNFNDAFWKDTTSTADWSTNSSVAFTSSTTASSLTVFKNEETISTATLQATDSGTISYQLSANTGSNWENVTKNLEHTFTNTGQELRWRAYSTGSATISTLEVLY